MILSGILNSVAHAAAALAVAGLWQGLAVTISLALCLKFSPSLSAAQRFLVWSAGFLAIVASPLLPLVLSIIGPSEASMFAVTASVSPHARFQLDARWTFAILALWLIASLVRAMDLVLHTIRLCRLWSSAEPVEVLALPPSQRQFQVCTTQFLDRPSVIGFFAPRVLIPDWLLPRLTPGELKQIVLHESTHLARRDDWTNLFQKLCLVLFPLNPSLWAIDRRLGKEREMACDEAVVRVTRAPRAYAACLANLAERGLANRKEALSLGVWQQRSELVERVEQILADHRSLGSTAAGVLLGAFGCSLLVATVGLAHCPKLVAFVPRTQAADQATLNDAPGQMGGAVYPDGPNRATVTAVARLVQAKAVMPSASIAKPFAGRAHVKTRADGELRAVSSEPGMAEHGSQTVVPHRLMTASVSADSPQELVFLTTWEQIETTAPTSRTTIADYDTQSSADPNAKSQASTTTVKTSEQPADGKSAPGVVQRRTTMTRLILRIVPSSSKSTYPAAIPFADGWLVIQL